jgi:hypothetical protein
VPPGASRALSTEPPPHPCLGVGKSSPRLFHGQLVKIRGRERTTRGRSAEHDWDNPMPTLILTPRFTDDAQSLWRAAGRLGWRVERLTSWQVPENLSAVPDPVLYVEGLFGPSLAKGFGLRLVEPELDWLPTLPHEHRKRHIAIMQMREARRLPGPAFMKPPNDKSFPARVYSGSELPEGYDEESAVLVSEVVSWELEFRCFVLDRKPHALSLSLRDGELQRDRAFEADAAEVSQAEAFIRSVLADERVRIPRASVLDVGRIAGRGWAVVEQNAAWGSGLYGCDPVRVLEVLEHASVRVEQ